jgi:hypothetical protein
MMGVAGAVRPLFCACAAGIYDQAGDRNHPLYDWRRATTYSTSPKSSATTPWCNNWQETGTLTGTTLAAACRRAQRLR